MLRVTKTFGTASVLLATILTALARDEIILRGNSGKGPLSAMSAGTNLILSWPAQPGSWKLLSQQPAFTSEWKPATSDYRTNAGTVSVTLPMPDQTTLYRVVRTIPGRKMPIPTLPPMPVRSTNRPPITNRPPNLPQPH